MSDATDKVPSWRAMAESLMMEPNHPTFNKMGEALDEACDYIRSLENRIEVLEEEEVCPPKNKEHCPMRLAGVPHPPHMPCDTGDFSRDKDMRAREPDWLKL